jgi:hypothetical protein
MISNSRNSLPVLLLVLCPLLPVSVAAAGQVTLQDVTRADASRLRTTTLLSDNALSTYRGFQFGMSLADAVKHSGMDPSEVSTVHKRPAMIQELDWNPERFSRNAATADSVEAVQFTFYNGKLSRAVVAYSSDKTKGMNASDMIQALSAQYGPAVRPPVAASFPSSSFSEGVPVLATWEDLSYSVNLVQSPYGEKFGLIAFSKDLDRLAEQSVAAGLRMDEQETPERQKKEEQLAGEKLEKARLENRSNFRP